MTHLGLAMIDVFKPEIQLILMIYRLSIELGCPGGRHPQNGYFMLFKEGDDPVIQNVRRSNGMLADVQFSKGCPAVSVYYRLLIDQTHLFNGTSLVGFLGNHVAGWSVSMSPWASFCSIFRSRAMT